MTDNRGTELSVGQPVAFNLSGQVAHGRILALHPGARGHRGCRVEVRLSHNAAGLPAGHVSRLTQPRNVLALKREGA